MRCGRIYSAGASERRRASEHRAGSGARPRSLTVLRHRVTISAWTPTVRELVLLALLSAFLCGVALI
jgi:hypothetical protein